MVEFIYKIEFERYLELKKDVDLYIYCKTSELRSTRSLDLLNKNNFKIKTRVEVILSSFENTNSSKKDNIVTVNCPFPDSEKGVKEILKQIKNCGIEKSKLVFLDITGFIKPYFFQILKGLLIKEKYTNVQILYTEPKFYHEDFTEYPFSKGPGIVKQIPSFGGHEGKKEVLVVSLGFEGNRSLEILGEISPYKTIAVNGFPSYLLDYKDQSIILNKDFLFNASCKKNIMRTSANDPLETIEILEEIRDENPDNLITVAPLGTKPMALGTLLFMLKYPEDSRAVFSYPEEYVSKNQPSQQYGKTWMYKIKN